MHTARSQLERASQAEVLASTQASSLASMQWLEGFKRVGVSGA